jgi:hypothetical protein
MAGKGVEAFEAVLVIGSIVLLYYVFVFSKPITTKPIELSVEAGGQDLPGYYLPHSPYRVGETKR